MLLWCKKKKKTEGLLKKIKKGLWMYFQITYKNVKV